MTSKASTRSIKYYVWHVAAIVVGTALVVGVAYFVLPVVLSVSYDGSAQVASSTPKNVVPSAPSLDKLAYDKKLLALAQVATSSPWYVAYLEGTTTVMMPGATTTTYVKSQAWPKRQPYPADGRALLPFNRIVAYYGNFYSTQMGVLGEYDKATVLAKLKSEVADWEAADPTTPVVPAIEYIDVTAQAAAGKDGKYRARMADTQIDKALDYAKDVNGIVILDIQIGLSTVEDEVPLIKDYLARPDVHLALDPEFAMHNGAKPGTVIGSMDAADINWAINYLSDLVKANNLPPKILVIHRFTEDMVTNYQYIKPTPQVQVVVQMDGWGSPQRKKNTYYHVVAPEPVQFTGVKLFYKNDLKEDPPRMLTKSEVLDFDPTPIFIQYQ